MKMKWKILIAVGLGALIGGVFLLLAFPLSKETEREVAEKYGTTQTPGKTPTPASVPKEENEPTKQSDVQNGEKEEPTSAPEPTEEADITPEPTAATGPTIVSENPEEDSNSEAEPVVTDVPEITPAEVPAVTQTVTPTTAPTVTPTATPIPTPTNLPTATPTPVPQRKYINEAKMGDNVWYRLTEDGVLYVTGSGATVRFDYTYNKETDLIIGGDYHYDYLMRFRKAKHIVIEEGITKLSSWSLMHLPDVQSITFPNSLQEIEDYCFLGTGMTINTVWIGLDKSKVKLGKDAFYGTVYQTEEDIKDKSSGYLPTPTPTPVLVPMKANSFYQALVEEAGLPVDNNDEEPYSEALIRAGILTAVEVRAAGEQFANQEAALILYKAACVFGIQGDTEIIAAAKKYDRISDKRGIVPGYETAVYFCFGSGIMTGLSDGEYSHTRSFNPKKSIGSEEGRLYCRRLFHQEERVPMSPDAQVIRTTNLPVQAKLYPYILESFPNEYYDTNYLYMYNVGTDDRAYPDTAETSRFLETWCTPSTVEEFSENQPERCRIFTSETDYLGFEKVGMDKVVERYRDTWEVQARQYLNLVFNFDYRTVREDTEWQEKIKNLNAYYHEWGKGAREGTCAGIRGIDTWMEQFLDNAEQYHTVVECDAVDFDMSTLFYSERFHPAAAYTIRVHLRYKITTDFEPGFSEMAEVLPVNMYGIFEHFTSFGEWKDVYAELTFDTNSFDRTGVTGVRVLEYNVDDAIRYHFDPKQYTK